VLWREISDGQTKYKELLLFSNGKRTDFERQRIHRNS